MEGQVYVQSIQALQDLDNNLRQFAGKGEEALIAIEREIQRTVEWLEERCAFWRREVEDRAEEVRVAYLALARCREAEEHDCSEEEEGYRDAQAHLRDATEELETGHRREARVEEVLARFQNTARGFSHLLTARCQQARIHLQRKLAELEGYLSVMPSYSLGAGAATSFSAAEQAASHESSPEATPSAKSWIDRGIQNVPISCIKLSDSPVHAESDFRKVDHETMRQGLHKLEAVVGPAVGQGANGEYFSQLDRQAGVDYQHGLRRVYDAFYGHAAIRVNKIGSEYVVVNGYHRLTLAKDLGWKTVPAQVVELIQCSDAME